MILERINSLSGSQGIILDGFPRNLVQAEALDLALARLGQRIAQAIYLEAPRALLLDRLSGRYICRAHGHVYNSKTNPPKVAGVCDIDGSELFQRVDDTGPAIEKRLDIFFAETLPLTEYYARQGKLIAVDGAQSIEEVNRQILAKLNAVRQ
jgi:adenylate kinase